MLTIRLKRMGRRNKPFYRIVVMEAQRSTQGAYIETVGHFNPKQKFDSLVLKSDRISYWISQGAQVSPTVHNFLVDKDVVKGTKKKASRMSKKDKKKDARKEVKAMKQPEVASSAVSAAPTSAPTTEPTTLTTPAPAE